MTAVVLLSGCQGGSAPSSPPSETSSTTASPTVSASSPAASATPAASPVYKPADATGKAQNVPVPVMPELAKENSKAGLEAFIGYWYAQLSYSYETGSTEQLRALSSTTCVLCASLRKGVESAWLDGRWIAGATIKSATIEADFDPSISTQVAVVQVIQEPIEIRMPGGSLYQDPTAATNSASRAALTFENQRWVLTDLGLIR
ncbi:DUF6318 family protein [Paenarthrobacter sp. NPDC091711]|uniref:DUF6318 family protein n=1 Tax=Paenarthrobacter sp. NPDC091711 TaxID=3364385 RepID=UPI00380B9CAD